MPYKYKLVFRVAGSLVEVFTDIPLSLESNVHAYELAKKLAGPNGPNGAFWRKKSL